MGSGVSTLSISSDQTRIIQNLRNEITTLNNQLSDFRRQSQVNVNISANTSEYEIKIRTLNSRIQELESQLRTVRIDYEGQLRTNKTDADKTAREYQLRINEFERRIANYEREIESLNKRLLDAQNNKVALGTPNTRTEGSIISSGVGQRQESSNTPLSESRNSSESGTGRSSTYVPGQYSSYGSSRVGLQGAQTGGFGASGALNIPTTGRISGNLSTQQIVQSEQVESGTISYTLSSSIGLGTSGLGVSSSALGLGSRAGGTGGNAALGGSGSGTGSRVSAEGSGVTSTSFSGTVSGSGGRTSGVQGGIGESPSGYKPGQYSNYKKSGDKQ